MDENVKLERVLSLSIDDNRRLYAAFKGLFGDHNWDVVIEWLQKDLDAIKNRLVYAMQEKEFYRLQGEAQRLLLIINSIKETSK